MSYLKYHKMTGSSCHSFLRDLLRLNASDVFPLSDLITFLSARDTSLIKEQLSTVSSAGTRALQLASHTATKGHIKFLSKYTALRTNVDIHANRHGPSSRYCGLPHAARLFVGWTDRGRASVFVKQAGVPAHRWHHQCSVVCSLSTSFLVVGNALCMSSAMM
jgi:hypothetical protein